jgi:hypothetical protein
MDGLHDGIVDGVDVGKLVRADRDGHPAGLWPTPCGGCKVETIRSEN